MTKYKPKLIEVALPLVAINAACTAEKKIKQGHPANIHHWWARRPLAAARAVIWASLVDDPSADKTLTEKEQEEERRRLFGILERLVRWKPSNKSEVLVEAQAEIDRCFPDEPPAVLDPFAGGGAIPLEAQRLGLKALSGDLNPVAVLIQRAMIEIPPRFADRPPVHPDLQDKLATWERAQGLAADIKEYGLWMRDEAKKRIGHLYPDATGPNGEKFTPIAWIWARTVASPDPSWQGHVPLVASWVLSNKSGKPKVWIEPIVDHATQTISYKIREGGEPTIKRTVGRAGGRCVATGAAMPLSYIRSEFQAGRAGQQLLTIAAQSARGRFYCKATDEHIAADRITLPERSVIGDIFDWPGRTNVVRYGMTSWQDLFTPRQLTALTTLSDLLADVRKLVVSDSIAAGLTEDSRRLRDGGTGAEAYADAIVTYLALVVDKQADLCNSLVRWEPIAQCPRQLFGRQAIPMVWDFAESNPLGSSSGSFETCLTGTIKGLSGIGAVLGPEGRALQMDATARVRSEDQVAVATDPPYYDNISYADLSDFFFVWLRGSLFGIWPNECATLLTPKADELIANRYRAGSKERAELHFESGMSQFMHEVASAQHVHVPATVYYAYKAIESSEGDKRSTGWDTFLQATIDAGLVVTATWPLRTENVSRLIAQGSNALASSVVLACRPRGGSAPLASRGEFIAALQAELPDAVRLLQSGNIAPVDLAQSTIGPGIKVFSRYSKVVEADGSKMPVSEALALINDALAEILDGEEAELDRDTRFAVTWYSQHGYNPGPSGDADTLARAKNTSLSGIGESGIGEARSGQFRLFERSDLNPDWDPSSDVRLTVWEATQHLVAALERSESEAAALLHRMGGYSDRARQLAYVLFQKATEKGWADEAGQYNGLITTWPSLQAIGTTATNQEALQL